MNKKNKKENNLRKIRIKSVTLHCSTADQPQLEKAIKLLEFISKAKPVKTLAKKRIPAWNIRPKLPIGCKVTVRKQKAVELLKMILLGVSEINEKQFNPSFLSFGIKEYIEIPNIPYQREIGIIGFEVMVALERPGFRIEKRKRTRSKIGLAHRITKAETIEFFKKNFNIKIA